MKIRPFLTEQFFALYEFTTPHVLASSDCETTSIAELLAMSGGDLQDLGSVNLGYTESQGNPEYRRLVAGMYENVNAEDVIVLTSPVEGIYLTMQTLVEASDEVVALSPAYDALHHVAEHLCGDFHTWQLVPNATGWEIDLDRLRSLVNANTRLIIVNFPHNPTGFQPDSNQLQQLVDIARDNDCWIFSDEIYRGLDVNLSPTAAIPSVADLYDKTIVLNGLSKTFGLPGLRAGWLVACDGGIREELIGWKHYTTICPPAPTEYLAIEALRVREQLAARNQQRVSANLKFCSEFMKRWKDVFCWRPPVAGSTALVEIDLPALSRHRAGSFSSAMEYCHDLAQNHGVLLLPGECLGCTGTFVRLGFGRESFSSALAAWEATLPPPAA